MLDPGRTLQEMQETRGEANPRRIHARNEMNGKARSPERQVEASEPDYNDVIGSGSNNRRPRKEATLMEALVGICLA